MRLTPPKLPAAMSWDKVLDCETERRNYKKAHTFLRRDEQAGRGRPVCVCTLDSTVKEHTYEVTLPKSALATKAYKI